MNRQLKQFEYNNNVINYLHKDSNAVWFNAIDMGEIYNKSATRWLDTKTAAEDIFYTHCLTKSDIGNSVITFEKMTGTEKVSYVRDNEYFGLVKVRRNGEYQLRGTWIHKSLAVFFAQWLSPAFRIQVSLWINQLVNEGTVSLSGNSLIQFKEFQANKEYLQFQPKNEEELQYKIKCWVDLAVNNARLDIENPIINTINTKATVRRIDFIQHSNRNVTVYELKNHKITTADIVTTIADKGYLTLCKQEFKKPVKFIFLSLQGITDEAVRLIEDYKSISFQTVNSFCESYFLKGIQTKWKDNKIQLENKVKDKNFNCLFSNEFKLNLSTYTNI